ncbi:hypothetical protein DFH07DRAFT_772472 [Mycena maculata]|uniref:Uncharacterized protein n=1 Tax=Mycena maculata TaxID=230809 RepID=A0AAD7JAY3_9AGAR|nr:hypothetical protein DFH07DRAFT_772472 [Mycena maculata]
MDLTRGSPTKQADKSDDQGQQRVSSKGALAGPSVETGSPLNQTVPQCTDPPEMGLYSHGKKESNLQQLAVWLQVDCEEVAGTLAVRVVQSGSKLVNAEPKQLVPWAEDIALVHCNCFPSLHVLTGDMEDGDVWMDASDKVT